MTSPRGEKWWYSPVLKRAALEVPSLPGGGFCCEEMGLGKVRLLGWLANWLVMPCVQRYWWLQWP